MKTIRNIGEILVIFVASVMVLIPVFGYVAMDFSHPADVKWVNDSEGKKEASFQYPSSISECTQRFFQLINSPLQPSYPTVALACIFWGIVLMCVSCSVNDWDLGDTLKTIGLKSLIVQIFLILVCVIGFQLNKYYLNPEVALKLVSTDQELVKKLLNNYQTEVHIGSFLLPLFSFIVFDIAVLGLGMLAALGMNKSLDWLAEKANWENREGREINGRMVLISSDRIVQYLRLEWVIRWLPWPVAVLKRERLSSGFLDAFLKEMAHEAKKFVTDSFLSNFQKALRECLLKLDEGFVSRFAQAWNNQFMMWARANPDQIKSVLAAGSVDSAEKVLAETAAKTVNLARQEISATVAETVRGRLTGFWVSLMGKMRPVVIQNQNGFSNFSPVLPAGTRVFLTRGNTTLVVVEQKPQIRSVLFSGNFVGHYGGLGKVEDRPDDRFKLAFPYTLFVLYFCEGRFKSLYFLYRTQPLGSIEDSVFTPNLPNMAEHGGVCLGSIKGIPDTGLAEQAEAVIAHFWNSQFNTDIPQNFVNIAHRERKLATLKRWEENTEKDPMFILSVEWRKVASLKKLLESLMGDGTQFVDVMREFDRIAKERIGEAAADVGAEVSKQIESLGFSGMCDKTAAKVLAGEMEKIAAGLVDMVLTRADRVFVGENQEAIRRLSEAVGEAIPETLSSNLGKTITQGDFSSRVDIWETMRRLVPIKEEKNDGTSDSDTDSQEG